jgi:hypothetical protein
MKSMQDTLLWSAAATAFFTWMMHTFVGGVSVARPLLADQGLPKAAKWLAYYCWHLVTLLIGALAAALAAAALGQLPGLWTVCISLFCFACSALSIAIAIKGGIAPWRFLSTSLFALTGALGLAGALL